MNMKNRWTLYIDESNKSEGELNSQYVVGGFLIRKDKEGKIFKALKQLKFAKKVDLKKEIKSSSLKPNEIFVILEKMQMIPRHCMMFVFKKEFSTRREINKIVENRLFKSALSEIVIDPNFVKLVEGKDVCIDIIFDEHNSINKTELSTRIRKKLKNTDEIKFVNSDKNDGVQLADIVVNGYNKMTHSSNKDLIKNNERSIHGIVKNIVVKK